MTTRPRTAQPIPAYVRMLARKIGARHEYLRDAIGTANIALIILEAFEEHDIVRRLAERISVGGKRQNQFYDPYAGYSPAQREFAERMDLWTLENVIVRVLTELDRRREKYLGGAKKMAARRGVK